MTNTLTKNPIVIAIVAVGVLIAGTIFYINMEKPEALSSQEAAERAMSFISQNIDENVVASLVDVIDENNVYKILLKIEETDYESYITKDGKFLFPSGFVLEEQTQEEVTVEESEGKTPASIDAFAQCLTDKGIVFYGSETCGWCNKEKELFGDSMQYITYVECLDPETNQWSQECQDAGVGAVPAWLLPDGEMTTGYKTFEQLAEMSSCPLE